MREEKLRKKLLGLPILLLSFLIIFSVCGIFLLLKVLNENTRETNENYLSHYMTEIEKSLDSCRLMIANNGLKKEVLKDLQSTEQEKIFRAKLSLRDEWEHIFDLYPEIDGIYLIQDDKPFFLINPKSDYSIQSLARNKIAMWSETLHPERNPFEDGWQVLEADSYEFLNCSVRQDDFLFGVWIWSDKFLNLFQEYREKGDNKIIFLTKDAEETQIKQLESQYLMITQYFEKEEFGLSLLIERENMISSVRHILWIFLFLGVAALIITVIYILLLYKAILRIETLNRKVYEERILKERLKGQLLKLQIKPHFFLNSLSNILSFLYVGEIKSAEDMIVYLANHIRYLLNSADFICLKDEIYHIKNYMAMQRIRFGPNFSCKISIPPELEDCMIPILSIQTFVENSMKHAKIEDEKICIFISAFSIKIEEKDYIKILIEDNAGGFETDILEKLRKGETLSHDKKTHIGISNVRERIAALYDGKGKLELSNGRFHGALIEILLPIDGISNSENQY
ncbi:MAG: histidine kinase [Eubacteriales bacterium]|nr:histidine kinase [Eubacteriales bacterium]